MIDTGLLQIGILLAGGFGACLLMAVRIAYRSRRRTPDEMSLVLRWLGWGLMLTCFVFSPLAIGLSSFVSIIGQGWIWSVPAMLLLVMPGLAYAAVIWSQYRESNQRALLWALVMADEQEMPLADAARAMAWERCDHFGAYCETVADRLQGGVRLDDALQLKQIDATLAIRMGVHHQDLGLCLRSWLSQTEDRPQLLQRYNYLLLVGCFLVMIGLFFLVEIAPVMQTIAGSFGAPMGSAATFANMLHQYMGWMIVPLILTPMLTLLATSAIQMGWLGHDLPIVGRLAMPLDNARLLRSLAMTAQTQSPISETLTLLARQYPKSRVRTRLTIAAMQHEMGRPWIEAIEEVKIVSAVEANVLRAAEQAGNLDWGLEEMARRKIRRIESKLGSVDAVVFPLCTVLLGIAVGFLTVSVFTHMVQFIEVWV